MRLRARASRLPWAAGLIGSLVCASGLAAQEQRCVFQIDNVDRQGNVVETPKGTNYFAGGNAPRPIGWVSSTGPDGRVKYRDSTLTMDASRGTYYKNRELWEARGNVTTRNLTTGSTLTGPSLDYYRVVKGVRDTLEMYATGRPKIQYFPTDSGGKAAEPYVIVGDRVRFKGDDRIVAGGKVTWRKASNERSHASFHTGGSSLCRGRVRFCRAACP